MPATPLRRSIAIAACAFAVVGVAAATPLPLLPGRYLSADAAGRPVTLEVAVAGTARLSLTPEKTFKVADLQVSAGPTGPCVTGLAPAALCFEYLAGPPPTIGPAQRPASWTGRWQHRATGGTVQVNLAPDGHFALKQSGPGGDAGTEGTWQAEGAALIIEPAAGGPPLRYTARIEAGRLHLSGGDLAFEVAFEPMPVAPLQPAVPPTPPTANPRD